MYWDKNNVFGVFFIMLSTTDEEEGRECPWNEVCCQTLDPQKPQKQYSTEPWEVGGSGSFMTNLPKGEEGGGLIGDVRDEI